MINFYRTWVKFGRVCDQFPQVIPGGIFIGIDLDVAFVFLRAAKEPTRVGQKHAMDERQTDMVLVDTDLANPRADNSPAPIMKITQPSPADYFSRIWSHREDNVS